MHNQILLIDNTLSINIYQVTGKVRIFCLLSKNFWQEGFAYTLPVTVK